MSTADNDNKNNNTIPSVCANCGNEGSDVTNSCNKCKMVKYCNAACKKKHRHKHKKDCEEHVKRAEERAAELHDEALFRQPPPEEDCPICFLLMPLLRTGRRYMTCCGKFICSGCIYAPVYDNEGNEVDGNCPFCRTPNPAIDEEIVERVKKQMETGNANAIYNFGNYYFKGARGFPQDITKALELWHRAAELGHSRAYYNIGITYQYGEGAELDKKKAVYYYELAAMGGNVDARHNLGMIEGKAGNHDRVLRHLMIAVKSGGNDSLEAIRDMITNGHATKDDYTAALRAYQEYLDEIKSDQRDKAAAAYENCRYY